MATSTAKRAHLYRFERQVIEGIINTSEFLAAEGVRLMTPAGSLLTIPYLEVKAVCFVSDFGDARFFQENNLFERRPKLTGIWARFTFRDNAQADGILAGNVLEWPAQGFLAVPPRPSANRQRLFIPRAALRFLELKGIVGAGSKRRSTEPSRSQLEMFGPPDNAA